MRLKFNTKRKMSFLLIVAMMFTMFSFKSIRAQAQGTVNINDYYSYPNETEYAVTDVSGMNILAQIVITGVTFSGVTITQENDIKFDITNEDNFLPIGFYQDYPFEGTYDGNFYKISGLNYSFSGYTGLFAYIDGATVKNVGIVNSTIIGGTATGAIVGIATNGSTISDCYCESTSLDAQSFVGGIVGELSNSTLTGCFNTSSNTFAANIAGGIAGKNDGTITRCYNSGNLNGSSTTTDIGGIAGNNDSTINNCYNSGSVGGGTGSTGGIAGVLATASPPDVPSLTNVYNSGFVSESGTGNIGGITGLVVNNGQANPIITNAYYLNTSASTGIGSNTTGDSYTVTSLTSDQMNSNEFAYNLNTTNGTTANSGIWTRVSTINNGYPIFPGPSEGPIYKLTIDPGSNGTISYNGVSNGAVYVQGGSSIDLTVTPDKGYTLTDLIINGTSEANTTGVFTMPSQDSTVQPVFSLENYSITADLNGGTLGAGVTIPTSYTINSPNITLPTASQITRPGYTFGGWMNSNNEIITSIPSGATGDVSITAVWQAIEYTITSYLNGGTLATGITIPETYNVGQLPITLPNSSQITRAGYTFDGWYTSSDFSGSPITEIAVGTTGDISLYAKWSLTEYTITVVLNGGTLESGITIPETYNILTPPIILPSSSEITREGYTFTGWRLGPDSTSEVISEIPQGSTGDVTIYAGWSINDYSLTSYLNGGTLNTGVTIPTSFTIDTLPIVLPTASEITRAGYTFNGWYENADFSGSAITEIPSGTLENVSIYANWTPITYTITTELNGGTLSGSIPSSYTVEDLPIELPSASEVTRAGYTFEGWYTTADFSGSSITEIATGTTGDITLYAKWNINDYSITAYLNGGTLNAGVTIPGSFTIETLPIVLPTASEITRAGYTFAGWYENSDFSGSAITEIPQGTLENVSIYANWTPITYTITTELNGGTSSVTIPSTYTVEDLPIVLPTSSEVTKAGYTFGGWYTTSDFSGDAITEIAAGTTGDLTLYAKWDIIEYSISAYLNGGTLNTGVSIPQGFTIETLPIVLPTASEITRAGYTFAGWYENSDFSGNAITEIPQGTLENVSIYANWTPITYTITTELNGGTSSVTIPSAYTVEDLPIVLPTSSEVTRAGYTFGGWYTTSDFSGNAITEIAAGTTGDLTLYAKWDIVEYSISAYLNGGTLNTGVSIPGSFTIETLPVVLPTASEITRSGYTFDGWYENSDFSGNAITEIPTGTLEKVSIYARWIPITYTITTELNGGTLSTSIPSSYTVEELPIVLPTAADVTRTGYTFGGWYTTVDFSGNAITEIPVGTTGNLILYAKWDIVEYSLNAYLNGGTLNTGVSIPGSFTIETLPVVLPTASEITRSGYTFDGWYTTADFSGSAITEIPQGTVENVSIYAKWTAITYTITTELNEGSLNTGVTIPDSYTVADLPIVLPTASQVTRAGFTFGGWYTTADFSGSQIREIPAGTTGNLTLYAKWNPDIYTITSVLNGGVLNTGVTIPQTYTVLLEPIVLPTENQITKTGYRFGGWYESADLSGTPITEIAAGTTGDITIYAKWIPEEYLITTELNGGTLNSGVTIPSQYNVEELPITLPTESQVTRTGYTFSGWYTTADFSGTAITEIAAGTTGDVTIYAKWTANVYTITADLNGGVLSQGVSIPSRYTVSELPIVLPTAEQITRSGYSFDGWYESADFSGSAITEIAPKTTGNVTIYAKWVPITYTITTELNEGTLNAGVTIPSEYNVEDLPIILPTESQITRTGYSFGGWYTTADFSGTAITEIAAGTTGDVTIYAKWTANVYTITADLNGGVLSQGVSIPSRYTVSELPIVLPTAEQITRSGYSFDGWYESADFSGSAITEIAPKTTGNVTIYAKWVPITYTITTELNGGTLNAGVTIPSEYNVEELPITLPTESQVTRTGYTFSGWYTTADFSGTAITEIAAGTTGDVTIYAKWTANVYTITADLNGGVLSQGVSIPSRYTVSELPIVLPTAEQITRPGYSFDGWYESADFSGSAITEIAPKTTGNVTIYAKWIPITYTITTELNGGTLNTGVTIPSEYNVEDLPITLPTSEDVTRTGYDFSGWYTNSDFSGSAITEIAPGTTGNLTIYAKWTPAKYSITAYLNGGTLNQGILIPGVYTLDNLPIILPTESQISRSGYTFDGWYENSALTEGPITEIPAGTTGNVTIYAKWNPITYSLNTELNGGELVGITVPDTYNVSQLPIRLPDSSEVTRLGYSFSGWYTTADFLGSAITEIAAGTIGDLTIYARWTPIQYPLNAYLNGGTLQSGITLPASYNVSQLPLILPSSSQITRAGYTFDGWYENADFSGSAVTEIPINTTGSVSIYAKWIENKYTITAYLNGGSLNEGVIIPPYYEISSLPIALPNSSEVTREGYTFRGWYTTADFSGNEVTEIPTGSTGDIILYAKWQANEYSISSYLNGGTLSQGVTIPESYIASNLPIVLPNETQIRRRGYTFGGWYTSADFSGSAITEIAAGTVGNVSIYARWIPNVYTINTFLDGGTLTEGISIPNSYIVPDLPIRLPASSEVQRSGYEFGGWYTNSSFTGVSITEIPVGTFGDINIYAKWIPVEYSITSDLNGGTLNPGVTIPQSYNVTQLPIVLPSYSEITRPGFAFAGWYPTPFFEGTPLTEIPAGTTGNLNLYVDWSEKKFSLVSYLNGGTLVDGVTIPTSFNEEDLPITLPTAEEITRPGFAFAGWYTNSSFTGDPITEIPVGTAQNTSIYAKWTEKDYSIITYLNGGTLAEGVTIPDGYNVEELPITLPNASQISRTGYRFDGWYTNSDFEGNPIREISAGTTGNITLYAKWTAIEYSISSYLNGGTLSSGVTIPLTYTISDLPISLPTAKEITRTGYTFAGWYTNSSFTGDPITEITEDNLGNITLYAKWIEDEYTITTYLNGGTLKEGVTIPKAYTVTELPIRLPAGTEISREGYVFAGWYTNSNFEGNPISEIPIGTTGDISIYAKWDEVSNERPNNETKEKLFAVTGEQINYLAILGLLITALYFSYLVLKRRTLRKNK